MLMTGRRPPVQALNQQHSNFSTVTAWFCLRAHHTDDLLLPEIMILHHCPHLTTTYPIIQRSTLSLFAETFPRSEQLSDRLIASETEWACWLGHPDFRPLSFIVHKFHISENEVARRAQPQRSPVISRKQAIIRRPRAACTYYR